MGLLQEEILKKVNSKVSPIHKWDTNVYKVSLKNYNFLVPKEVFNDIKNSLLMTKEEYKSAVKRCDNSIKDPIARNSKFMSLLVDGKEVELVNYLSHVSYPFDIVANDLHYIKQQEYYTEHYYTSSIDSLEYLNHNSTEILMDCSEHVKEKLKSMLLDKYQRILNKKDIKIILKLKESLDKIDKVHKYKKDVINCKIISI